MIASIAGTIRQKEATELKLFLGGFLLCLLTALPAAAQSMDLTCQSIDMAGYANVSFCLPAGVPVSQADLAEANYTGGREVKTLLLFDTSEVDLHLLYPCVVSAKMQESDIKSQVKAFDTKIEEADYSTTPISISGRPAVWGHAGNWTFVAYQPADNVLALMYFDESMPESIRSIFLEALEIMVNQTVSPLWPGYCTQASSAETTGATVVYKNASSYSDSDADYNLNNSGGPEAEARMARFEATKEHMMANMEDTKERLGETEERMMANMEDTKERLGETKERLGGYGMIPNPLLQD